MSHPDTLDADLFASLKRAITSVNDVEIIRSMMVVESSEYARFITNEVENPQFRIKRQEFDIKAATQALETCAAEVSASSAHEVVVQLYRAKLKNQQLRFDLLDAAAQNDDERFGAVSLELYGRPRRAEFAMLVHDALSYTPTSKTTTAALQRLTDELGHVSKPKQALPTDILPPPIDDDTEALSASAVVEIFEETLRDQLLTDWQIQLDTSGSRQRFSVNPYSKIVYVPNDEQLANRPYPLTKTAAEALAAHEIGVHAKRAAAGYASPLQLLGLGLDGYLPGEEGLASYSQQQIEGAEKFYGQDRYLAVSLALGLDGTPRDFRAVFSLMLAYYQLVQGDAQADNSRTVRRAWEVCHRIFRGTTGQSTGCVFTRDIAYFAGNLAIWEYMVTHPERYTYLFMGKFDPLNDRHVTSLQTLQLLPEW